MLLTTLKLGETLRIGDTTLTVLRIHEDSESGLRQVRLGFEADAHIVIDRREVDERKRREREAGG